MGILGAMALADAESDLVKVFCDARKADGSPETGSFVIRPIKTSTYRKGTNQGLVVTERRVVGTLDNNGRGEVSVIRSDSANWMMDQPVPYKVWDRMTGSRRAYYCYLMGTDPIDLATVPKYMLNAPPPIPTYSEPEPMLSIRAFAVTYQCDVYGQYCSADLKPETGYVSIRPINTASHNDPPASVVTIRPVKNFLDNEGKFAVQIITSDSDGWMINGKMRYRVIERTAGGLRSYCTDLLSPGPVDIAMLYGGVNCPDTLSATSMEVPGL